jgi:hypothetical protein
VNFSVLRRGQLVAALAVSAGAIALAGTMPASAATAGHQAPHSRSVVRAARPAGTDWVHAVVLVNCQHHAVVLPRTFILTCADANDALVNLRWVSWRGVAYGSGTERINTCHPNCAAGHFRSYHALITVWRPRARGHGTGQLRFTRLTEVYTGARPLRFTAGGRPYHPATFTWHV